jgi:hypothetical protein
MTSNELQVFWRQSNLRQKKWVSAKKKWVSKKWVSKKMGVSINRLLHINWYYCRNGFFIK